jgi:hypothetical protein
MKVVVSKSQYRRVFLNYLESFVGDLLVKGKTDFNYRVVETVDGEYIADLWHTGPVTKGCETELYLEESFVIEVESFIPISRKKVFSEVMLEYFYLKTGIKCYCIEFDYAGAEEDDTYKLNLKKNNSHL